MAEFEDMLNKVLNDPAQMEQIMNIASNFMGNGESTPTNAPINPQAVMENIKSNPKIGNLIKNFGGFSKGAGAMSGILNSGIGKTAKKFFSSKGSAGDKKELINGICPFLSEERRDKLQRAAGLAKTLNSAGSAFLGKGG